MINKHEQQSNSPNDNMDRIVYDILKGGLHSFEDICNKTFRVVNKETINDIKASLHRLQKQKLISSFDIGRDTKWIAR